MSDGENDSLESVDCSKENKQLSNSNSSRTDAKFVARCLRDDCRLYNTYDSADRNSTSITRIGDSPEPFPPIIPLNVGGVKYMTRLSTLRAYPDSMLAAMFSGRHHIDRDEEGNYFLDSNGLLFSYILDFLRFTEIPPNTVSLAVFRDANYYGLSELVNKLQFTPEVVKRSVEDAHRGQFPNYQHIKTQIIKTAMENAKVSKVGEVVIFPYRVEFVPKSAMFNMQHACVADTADVHIGPWDSAADEETFIRCLETDLLNDGFNIKLHEVKKKCRYYIGQTCPKFIYRLQFIFY